MDVVCKGLRVELGAGVARRTALEGLNLEVRDGEFVSVIGPSGCGKTTLLRAVAGLVQPTKGSVSPGKSNATTRIVFQEKSLFPWMTVLENAAFGLEMAGVNRATRERRATDLLERYGLAGHRHAYPHQVSVGMKQRIAVIRAFLADPRVLLMDEPFAALDAQARAFLHEDLMDLWRERPKTVVFVTHDVEEALYLADRVVVLSAGPGHVVNEYAIDWPRQDRRRLLLSAEFLEKKRQIISDLQGFVR